MNNYTELLHQASKIVDYRDRISSGLFQIHRILREYFPNVDVSCVNELNKILDDKFYNEVIAKLGINEDFI
jgi:hypothetical protein